MERSRLEKQWKLTIAQLEGARSLIPSTAEENEEVARYLNEYKEFLDHNEFELALDMLDELGEIIALPEEYWRYAKRAGEIMGLSSRSPFYLQKIRNARDSANE